MMALKRLYFFIDCLGYRLHKVKVNEEKQSEKPYLNNTTVNYSMIQPPEFFIFYSGWKNNKRI